MERHGYRAWNRGRTKTPVGRGSCRAAEQRAARELAGAQQELRPTTRQEEGPQLALPLHPPFPHALSRLYCPPLLIAPARCAPDRRPRQPGQSCGDPAENTGRRMDLENTKAGKPELCRFRSCFSAFQIHLRHKADGTPLYREPAISRGRLVPSATASPRTGFNSATRQNTNLQNRPRSDRIVHICELSV